MLSYCVPSHDVVVEKIEPDIPSESTIGIGVTGILLETWCAHELQWVVSEPAAASVWIQVVGQLRGYLGTWWMSGALQGDHADEAFMVTCDQSTMTPQDIRDRHLICLVGLALVTPGEFTFYRIHIHHQEW